MGSYASAVRLTDHSSRRRNHSRHAPRRRSDRTRPLARSSSTSRSRTARAKTATKAGARSSVDAGRGRDCLDGSGGEVGGLWVRDPETSSTASAGACAVKAAVQRFGSLTPSYRNSIYKSASTSRRGASRPRRSDRVRVRTRRRRRFVIKPRSSPSWSLWFSSALSLFRRRRSSRRNDRGAETAPPFRRGRRRARC